MSLESHWVEVDGVAHTVLGVVSAKTTFDCGLVGAEDVVYNADAGHQVPPAAHSGVVFAIDLADGPGRDKASRGGVYRIDLRVQILQADSGGDRQPLVTPRVGQEKRQVPVEVCPAVGRRVEGQEPDGHAHAEVRIAVAVHDVRHAVVSEAVLEAGPELVRTGDIGGGAAEVVTGGLPVHRNGTRSVAAAECRIVLRSQPEPVPGTARLFDSVLIQFVEIEVVVVETQFGDQLGSGRAGPLELRDVVHGPAAALVGGSSGVERQAGCAAVNNLVVFVFPVAQMKTAEFVFGVGLPGEAEGAGVDAAFLDAGPSVRVE